ncbi:hypothetical protein QMW78_10920, partial [Cronobacter turicensis]
YSFSTSFFEKDILLIFIFLLCYFYFYFFLYSIFCGSILGILFFSLLMAGVSYVHIFPVINPFFLLCSTDTFFLPNTASPVLNTILLFIFIPLFCLCLYKKKMGYYFLFMVFVFFIYNTNCIKHPIYEGKEPKIAVIQIGLYLKNGGSVVTLANDLHQFIKKNPSVEILIFSENTTYGYKGEYKSELTEDLLQYLKTQKIFDTYAFLFSFYGYENINNMVSMFMHNDTKVLNQKKILVPFWEEDIFNKNNSIKSKYLYADKNLTNKAIRFKTYTIRTFICYDSLFPLHYDSQNNDFVFVQSNFNTLNVGNGFNNLLILGSKLAKFSTAPQSNLFINAQNFGGTVVIRGKDIDMDLFLKSKKEPFVVIN